jgi:hypothetical protein
MSKRMEGMSNQNAARRWMKRWIGVLSIAVIFCLSPARSQNSSGDYTFLVGAGTICDGGDTTKCPAVVKSGNGDSYQISGAGTFNSRDKSVVAAGTYTHVSPNGTVMESGVWSASQLVRFDSYGIAPAALTVVENAGGNATFGAKPKAGAPISELQRVARFLAAKPTGGLGIFRIRMVPMLGPTKTAELQINCALGAVPRDRSVEGIRLMLDGSKNEFSEEVSGRVMFLSVRPEVKTQSKSSVPEPTAGSTEPPIN